jgi:predicted nucleic acid-binding protein
MLDDPANQFVNSDILVYAHDLSAGANRIISDLCNWRIHEPAFKDLFGAIDLQQRYSLSIWDAMVVHSAARLMCQVIWSEDMSHGQVYEGIRLINPFLSGVENSEANQ